MNTLDIIKYISFRQKNSKVLTIILLPVAYREYTEYKSYYYCIEDKKYTPTLLKEYFCKVCNIRTVFGDDYIGYWTWFNRGDKKIMVESNSLMRYENNCLRSINCNKRFSLMEIGSVY